MKSLFSKLILLVISFYLLMGCEKLTDHEIYKRPDWLPGKLYTTVVAQENLSIFAECLVLSGLDTIVDVSGSWSIFAPTNEAMQQYLSENHYASVSDIPHDVLVDVTKFHIIQNPWSLEQLQSLSAYGWRSGQSKNSNYYAYKRETILKNPIDKIWIKRSNNKEMIVLDSTNSDAYKKVFVESRKYAPIFYDEYLSINKLTSDDFNFYFGRDYELGNVYYSGGKILQADIFAENGFVHIIDRVVNPMLNAKELLEKEISGESYKLFLEMVQWYYPTFEPNIVATFNQPAFKLGGIVDTLWEIDYAGLEFAIHKERIGYIGSNLNETLVKHNGLFVPTDEGFRDFIDNILTVKSGFPHWRDHSSLPRDVYEIIISQHFKAEPLYPSTGVYKGIFSENSGFHQNEDDIIRKEFGSNCTFLGLKSYIPDRVFTSVTGPVFLRPNYSVFRQALLYCGIEDDIAYRNDELYFFPISNYALEIDSSLILNWIDKDENRYNFMAFNRAKRQMEVLRRSDVKNRILDQVGTPTQNGSGNKEIIRTLRGNYITWDHSDNTIKGTRSSTIGYKGNVVAICKPVQLTEPADNGTTWSVNYWFNFGY